MFFSHVARTKASKMMVVVGVVLYLLLCAEYSGGIGVQVEEWLEAAKNFVHCIWS